MREGISSEHGVDAAPATEIGWETAPTPSRTAIESNVEIYERILEAFNRDGVDGVAPFFAEDVEVYDPDLPNRSYRGPVAARRAAEMLTSGFEKVEIREFRLVPAGDRVVALLRARGKAERHDLELETREGHTVTFRDGKVVHWRVYLDQSEALSEAGLDPGLATAGRR